MVIIEEIPPPPSTHPWKYHVFLSFRGEDTRNNFTGHLCSALRQKGIITFMDDQLIRGEEIAVALLQAIELSKISIIVFSEDYAFSKWCLDELVKILDCQRSIQQKVLPVFFKVNPSDIRNHRGSFGGLECKFKDNMEKVQKWKSALSEAANLSGWPISEECSEANVIQVIVEDISKRLKNIIRDMFVAKYPVGIEPRAQVIHKLLGVEGRDVHMVGIWGTGGIGKTTIAKAVYNSIACRFDGSCFLENVRENQMGAAGFVELQKKLLCEILGGTLEVPNASTGINMIRERLQYKSVLLVLDDVSDIKQLDNLAGDCKWFGKGSKIIITTRDKKILTRHSVNLIYRVQELAHDQALELFSHYAFNSNRPLVGYEELTESVLRYTQGLPLALTLLGSSLWKCENVEMWRAAIDGSESYEIKEVLQISYNLLNDELKAVFLDIACFFKGENREHVVQTLGACGRKHANVVIDQLIGKALISIDEYKNLISMHDLVQEMGRDIVYRESPEYPERRSRLWSPKDVYNVLTENTGTDNIIGIKMELPEDSDEICFSGTTFSNLQNLRVFIYRAGHYSGVLDNLPNRLRLVEWPDCHLQFSGSDLPNELVLFNMPKSRITVLGNCLKPLRYLTSINLEDCKYLTKLSDLSGIPNLQYLELSGCRNLVEVHPSVGFLYKLTSLNLFGCSRLETFPTEVHWNSMRTLTLPGCRRLESFISIVRMMGSLKGLELFGSGVKELHSWIGCCTSLEYLDLAGTPIKQLPSSIGNLISLTDLYVCRTLIEELPSSIGNLTSLKRLELSGSSLRELPSSIGCLISLKKLDVSGTLIKELPSSIGCLTSLKYLYASNTFIEKLPPSIGVLTSLRILKVSTTPMRELPSSVGNLTSLFQLKVSNTLIDILPDFNSNLYCLDLCGCKNLRYISELPYYIREINLDDCVSLENISKLSNTLEQKDTLGNLCLMNLSNCNRLIDNLGVNIVSKMAKALLDQLLTSGGSAWPSRELMSDGSAWLDWNIILPSLEGVEVPDWFDSGNVETTMLRDCELLNKIPMTLKGKRIGLLVCAVIEMTRYYQESSSRYLFKPDFVINKQRNFWRFIMNTRVTKVRKSSADDNVWVCLASIDFKVADHEVRVLFNDMSGAQPWFSLKSFGVHLVNMQQIDDHVSGKDLVLEIYRTSNAGSSDFENKEGASIASVASDDRNSGEVDDDHLDGEQQQGSESHHLPTTSRLERLG